MKRLHRLTFAATLAAMLGGTTMARANGRFPESNQIVFAAHDPDLVIVRVTFGLLVSHDRGKTFQWVCEQSIGYNGVEDPMYAVTPQNAYIGTTFQGITVSHDNACTFGFAGGELDGEVFVDLSQSPADRARVVVFSSKYDKQDDAGNLLFNSRIWETTNEAQSFTKLGSALDPTLLGYTIDVTNTDPDPLYITAVRQPGTSPKAVLLVSRNHGQTWDEEPIPLGVDERAVFIAGIDPTNAERVYLRTSAGVDKPTRLILREGGPDGGAGTQKTVFTAKAALLGFALSPDGGKVYVGGPKDGLLVASTQDFAFTQRVPLDDAGAPKIEVQCLGISDEGLWACSNERSGFIAGLSKDDGATFEPRLRFCQIAGPLTCAAGTPTNDRCGQAWPNLESQLGCDDSTDGGGVGQDGASVPPGGAVTPPPKNCDCHASPASPWGALVAAVGAAALLLRRGRRRPR